MKRNKVIETLGQDKLTEHKQRVAFHEAGHAAGIHLNNKARHLPPVFLKLFLRIGGYDSSGCHGLPRLLFADGRIKWVCEHGSS